MPEGRPNIPAQLKRQILVEAGHRCAIPTCRQIPVEFCHIEPWAKVKAHSFENIIALCPTCHSRNTKGDIDTKSLAVYKANLGVLNLRYNDIERRLLGEFASNPDWISFHLPGPSGVFVLMLVRDGLIQMTDEGPHVNGVAAWELWTFTREGLDLVEKVRRGLAIPGSEMDSI